MDLPRRSNDDPHDRPLPRCGGFRAIDPEALVHAILSESPAQRFSRLSLDLKRECHWLLHGRMGTYLATLERALWAGQAIKELREIDPERSSD